MRELDNVRTTYQQILRRLPVIGVLQQTAINEGLGFLRVSALWRQPWGWLIHDVLQQLQNTHGHRATLQTDPLALPLVLLSRAIPLVLDPRWREARQRNGARPSG